MNIEDKIEVLDGGARNETDVTDLDLLKNEIDILQDLFEEQDVDFGFDVIAEILMMDDENFAIISEFFLTEFETSIKNNKQIFTILANKNNYHLMIFKMLLAQ